MTSKTCTGASSLDDLKKKIGTIPKPKTEEITIESSKSASLEKGIFQGFASLTALYVSGNDIPEVKEEAFTGLASLKYLYLNNNNIQLLGINVFKGLTKLCELDLSCNKLTNLQAGSFTELAMTANGACLNLANNQIEEIEIGAFKSVTVLYGTLDLSNNKLTRITGEMFCNLLIEKFDMSGNKIGLINENAFVGSNFKMLHMERNAITNIHPFAFNRCEVQNEFHLEDNKLHSYSGLFKCMRSLKELYMDGNGLTTLSPEGFYGLDNLDTLSLNRNRCVFEKDSFKGLENIEYLYLEDNGLETLPIGVLTALQNLRTLNLSYNCFKELTPNMFWVSESDATKTYFYTLALHHNEITRILPGAFDGLDQIEDLQLYNNKLSKFDEESFRSLSFIGNINLQNNVIEDADVLKKIPPCRQIQLGGNEIEIKASGIHPENLDLGRIDMISFNYCCFRFQEDKWKFDDRFHEPTIQPK